MLLYHLQPFPLKPGYPFSKQVDPYGKLTMQGRILLSSSLEIKILRLAQLVRA